ncbi:MAG: hypothetical protein IMY80_02540 [Chloroflexi bacterium]|nr:hypothetical protein [Chloroflexota bacterium]
MSSNEKDEKEEKGGEQGEGFEEKWVRDPLGTAMSALIIIWLGVTMLLANLDLAFIGWGDWWAWFLLGIGGIFILEAIVRLVVPDYRRPVGGKIIAGVVLLIIGASGSFLPFDFDQLWPLIPIAVGLAILFGGLFKWKRP